MLSLLLTLVTNAICVWRHNLQRHDLTGTHNVDDVRVLVARPSPTTHSPHPKKGCWGTPLLENEKVSRLLGFLVFGFVVSKFLGFVVSCFCFWFPGFKVSEFQGIIKCVCHVFWKILISYPECPINLKMDLHHVSVPAFSKYRKVVSLNV